MGERSQKSIPLSSLIQKALQALILPLQLKLLLMKLLQIWKGAISRRVSLLCPLVFQIQVASVSKCPSAWKSLWSSECLQHQWQSWLLQLIPTYPSGTDVNVNDIVWHRLSFDCSSNRSPTPVHVCRTSATWISDYGSTARPDLAHALIAGSGQWLGCW